MDDELAPGIKDGEDLDQLLARWEWFASEVAAGFSLRYWDDFRKECDVRTLIQECIEHSRPSRTQLDSLWEIDNRIRTHIRPLPSGSVADSVLRWWENSIPAHPNPDMIEELRELNYWPYPADQAP